MAVWIILLADTPLLAQQQASQDAGPILKAYSCPVAIIEGTAARLREKFKGQPDVRITTNLRTAQILVYAPLEAQSQIADSMAGIRGATASPPNRAASVHNPPAATDARASKSISVSLQNISGKQLEETLLNMLGNRLTAVPPAELGASSFQSILPGGAVVRLDILPQVNRSSLYGTATAVDSFARLIKTLDSPPRPGDESMRLVSLNDSSIAATRRAVEAIQSSDLNKIPRNPVATKLYQDPKEDLKPKDGPTLVAQAQMTPQEEQQEQEEDQSTMQVLQAPGGSPEKAAMEIGQIGPVQVEMLEGLDVLIIRGHKKDVEQVMNVIKQVEQLSAKTEPAIEVYKLKYIGCQALADLITQVYGSVYEIRQGTVSITALVKPNALLILGRKENVKTVLDLVRKLDQPAAPEMQFHVFRLQHTPSATAYNMIYDFYNNQPNRGTGLDTRVLIENDDRLNSLIIQASPRDMAEVAELIANIDKPASAAVNELRVIPLRYSMANDLATVIMSAISGQAARAPTAGGFGAPVAAAAGTAAQRSIVLRFLNIDTKTHKLLQSQSGILSDINVSPDIGANSLIVSAPAESMGLMESLIQALDQLPLAEAEIKVFTITNGDASSMMNLLSTLFGPPTRGGQAAAGGAGGFGGGFGGVGGAGATGLQTVTLEGEGSMIPVRLAVDSRTNSIIASGSHGDLETINVILLRLDGTDVRNRENYVYKLKNVAASYAYTAISTFLTNLYSMETGLSSYGAITPFALIEQEVIVVAEPSTNSLIISATPKYFQDIKKMIDELDKRPPMVLIQVLIAQITLTDDEQFGVELGLQDGLLFDRSAALAATSNPPGQGNNLNPGYAFPGSPLGNSPTNPAGILSTNNAPLVGTQGLSNFALNRADPTLGWGGLVLSASSESVNVLLRALKHNQRIEVLSRPQVMTMDNQEAWVQVGAQVGLITGSASTVNGQTNTVTPQQVGLILTVQPRVSEDGVVVMVINATKSSVGPEAEGTPITSVNGQLIREPQIPITTVQTTVSALDGQTIILGGLITKDKVDEHRKVPWVGDIPILGRLFRYDSVHNERDELLIIMTPHIVTSVAQADELKKIEAARMNWCLGDVIEMTGDIGLRPRNGDWPDSDTEVIYPDVNPRAEKPCVSDGKSSTNELIPTPPAVINPDKNAAPSGPSNVPPEAPRAPQPDSGAMAPQQRYMPANSAFYFNTNGQVPLQASTAPQGIRTAAYERPAGYPPQPAAPISNPPYPNTSNAVTPAVYDAPPRYPTTQQPFYR
ncbi:MAG: secretin N-terminal domain-containing protein [Thermoguttaceae bacterium]